MYDDPIGGRRCVTRPRFQMTGPSKEPDVSRTTLMRLSGCALIVGGLGASVAQFVHPATPDPAAIEPYLQTAVPVHILLYLAVITLSIGMAGLIAHFRT